MVTDLERRLLARLADGRWHVIGSDAKHDGLVDALQVKRREIEEAVLRLRLGHTPIVSGPKGVRYSSDPAEMRANALALRERALGQLATAKALDETAARWEGQAGLWDVA